MKNKRFRLYALILVTGLAVIILVEALCYVRLQAVTKAHNERIRESYKNYIEQVNLANLAAMTRFIANHYPVLRDTARLKREAGTDWYWNLADELHAIARTFNVTYIYYIENNDGVYRFLLSSGIRRDEHPEWLGTPVWKDAPPDFIERAYQTGQQLISPEPSVNEWGELISAVLPILNEGVVAGLLGIDYDVSIMEGIKRQEGELTAQRQDLLRIMRLVFISSCALIGILMLVQMLIGLQSTPASLLSNLAVEEYIRMIIDTVPISCSLWDQDGNLIFGNAASFDLYGIKSGQLAVFNDFLKRCPETQPDGSRSRDFAVAKIRSAFASGFECFEWMYQTADGKALPVETTMVRISWKDYFVLAIYSRDLREIKAREAAALELDKRMKIMLDTMAFACFFFDASGTPIDCNRRALELYGCQDKAEFLENFYRFSPEYQHDGQHSRDKAMRYIREAFETGTMVFRWEHRKANGTPLPAEITLIRVAWNDDYRIVAYARDLTSLMETEDNLRRILSVVENSPNFTFYMNAAGGIEYLNPAVSTVTGFSRQELLSDGFRRLLSPGDFHLLETTYLASALENRTVHFEMNVLDRQGGRQEYSFSAFAAELHDGKTGIGILGRNISGLKQTQRDLTAAKEQAERALREEHRYNQAKSDFLSRVSHELRTPINAIMGMTSKLQKAAGETGVSGELVQIEASAGHLLSIVNDILDMTSFDTGGFEFIIKPFSFTGAIESVIAIIKARAKDQGQTFVTAIDSNIPGRILSDEKRLKQMLLHLLSNAVKFTPEKGTIGLSAGLLEQQEQWCRIRFEISDNGIGINGETRRRLWDIFEQADNSITRRFGGLGLGLPLAKRIIDFLEGDIRLESEPGKGSRFICDIRLDLAPDESEPKAADARGSTEAAGMLDLTRRRFLAVDDVAINRNILAVLLEDTGAIVDEAENGAEAIRMFSGNKYDMVFMDIHMPVMDGFNASRGIRASALPWARTTPIIAISADTSAEIHSRCLEAGINAFLSKPVNVEELFETIKKWLPPL